MFLKTEINHLAPLCHSSLILCWLLFSRHVRVFMTAWTAVCQASLFLTICIQWRRSFPFSFAFLFSSSLSYLQGLLRQSLSLLAFLFLRDGSGHHLLYNVTNLHPEYHSSGTLSTRSNCLNLFITSTV